MFESFYKKLEGLGIVPVVVLDDVAQAVPMADALMAAGMCSAEVTFRTDAAADCIRAMREAYPEMAVGAGTVLTVEQIDQAVAAGAEFIVAPNFDSEVVQHCIDIDVPVLPRYRHSVRGWRGREDGPYGYQVLPAAQYGGLNTIKAICAPFTRHRFMPTGGVSLANVEEYLSCDKIIACGGTWMVKASMFADGDFSQVQQQAAEAINMVKKIRG